MKKRVLSLVALFLFVTMGMFAKEKTEMFLVNGNCGMCEKRIETAASGVKGVSSTDWDKETKMMVVAMDTTQTNIHKVEMAIAKVGHDTPMHKASDEAYNKLPGCCKYERIVLETPKGEMKHEHK